MFLEIINPVFLADPLGAIVGKTLTNTGVTNPKWVGEKTIGKYYFIMIHLTFSSPITKLSTIQ